MPTFADEVVITQGSVGTRRFVAVYGYQGRITAAVTFNQGMWLEFYQRLIEQAAPFPPRFRHRRPSQSGTGAGPGRVPARVSPTQDATVVVTGHDPS